MVSRLTISLPKTLEDFAKWRVRYGSYASVSDYFRELVRVDQRLQIEKQEQYEAARQVREPLASAARQNPLAR